MADVATSSEPSWAALFTGRPTARSPTPGRYAGRLNPLGLLGAIAVIDHGAPLTGA
jgi:hypothetical protein